MGSALPFEVRLWWVPGSLLLTGVERQLLQGRICGTRKKGVPAPQRRQAFPPMRKKNLKGKRGTWEMRIGYEQTHVHTAIFNIDNQQGPTVRNRELCSVLCNYLNGNLKNKRHRYRYKLSHSAVLYAVLSRSAVSNSLGPHGLWSARLLCPWASPGKNPGMGCHSLFQGIFPTKGLNPSLPCWGQKLYHPTTSATALQ